MRPPQNIIKNVLCFYAASQTYTSTVFEHLDAFRKHSKSSWFYADMSVLNDDGVSLAQYDAVVIHYSVRLPFGQVSDIGIRILQDFKGLRVLFIQDEYDNTNVVKKIIGAASFDLVFSVVPDNSMSKIYPPNEFPQTKFVSVLTGYVPDELTGQSESLTYPSTRSLFLAYRGRKLPIRYGRLGQEKIAIGHGVKDYCNQHGIACDIEWEDRYRIYGKEWYAFIASAKAMLGSESGSNVFDWDGDLQTTIDDYVRKSWKVDQNKIYKQIIEEREVDELMNQISPRAFEMAAAKTIMGLYEGSYSGVLEPGTHFLPLKKDFSNLGEVIAELRDDIKVDAMADRVYRDLILSGKYSYKKFVGLVDNEMDALFGVLKLEHTGVKFPFLLKPAAEMPVQSTFPLHAIYRGKITLLRNLSSSVYQLICAVWVRVPKRFRPFIKRLLRRP